MLEGTEIKIVYDASPLFNQKTGIGYYTYNLITNVQKLYAKNEYILYSKYSWTKPRNEAYQKAKKSMAIQDAENFSFQFSRLPLKAYYYPWRYLGIPLFDICNDIKGDIFHGVNFLPLPSFRGKSVVTIHDLYFLINPEFVERKSKAILPREIRFVADKADFIITVSEATKKDVVEMLGVSPSKVKAIPLAAADVFKPIDNRVSINEFRTMFIGGEPFILYVGTLEPRKNLRTLVEAYNNVVKKGLPHRLVLVGKKGWQYEDIFAAIQNLKLEDNVIVTEYVDEQLLPLLYNAADLFVYPSLYEGFGLPVIEALACGTPVITSNVASLPEVAGDAAILVNPLCVEELTEAMLKLLSDRELQRLLSTKGIIRAKQFSWTKAAHDTVDVYKHVLNS